MFNAYMLTSDNVRKVYMFWVRRYYELLKVDHWTPEWQQACNQISRMQQMYDSLEGGKIIYLWHWHKMAKDSVK